MLIAQIIAPITSPKSQKPTLFLHSLIFLSLFLPLHHPSSMESTKVEKQTEEVTLDLSPLIKVYKGGRVERLRGTEIVPPSQNPDPKTGVSSKDVVINPETNLSARIFLPKITNSSKKLPVLIYFHGGGFLVETPFSPPYHSYLSTLVSEANVVAVSVDYSKAPEHPVPAAYEDSWVALKWVLSHSNGDGSESWINTHVDFDRVFLAGDSCGANLSHNMAIRLGTSEDFDGMKLLGIVLVHPFFWGVEPIGAEMAVKEMIDKMWSYAYPSMTSFDEPIINPRNDPNLSKLGCKKILVCVGEKDIFKERGWYYYETMKEKSGGWNGDIEIVETEGEGHVFHLIDPTNEKALDLMKKFVSFLTQEI